MYFTREAQTAPEETEANRTGGVTTASAEKESEYDPGVIALVFGGAPGEPSRNGTAKLLRSPALSSRSNAGVRVIALSRAQQTHGNRFTQRLIKENKGSGLVFCQAFDSLAPCPDPYAWSLPGACIM